jgi:hypothetical protein
MGNYIKNKKGKVSTNDVFTFRHNAEYCRKNPYPYHCFDGILIAKVYENGRVVLTDTYWSSNSDTSFSLKEAKNLGELTFVCNLDDMVEVSRDVLKYYDDKDVVCLPIHAGYRTKYLLAKGSERSAAKMAEVLKGLISEEESKIRYANNSIQRYKASLDTVLEGDTSIYI